MASNISKSRWFISAIAALALTGCAALPAQGPSTSAFVSSNAAETGFEVVDVTPDVLGAFQAVTQPQLAFGIDRSAGGVPAISAGDAVAVSIWEAGGGGLFSGSANVNVPSSGAAPSNIPAQEVGADGAISLPYIGRIQVAGLTQRAAEARIQTALQGQAVQPQVVVTVVEQGGSTATVVGAGLVPLSQAGDRVLDVLAKAGGPQIPVEAAMVTLSRGGYTASVPLRIIVQNPLQNIGIIPGDVITVTEEPQVFFAVGATGRNSEIDFGHNTITVQQAIARSGGLIDGRSDPSGVFVLRLERPEVVRQYAPSSPLLGSGGLIPVAYRFNMRDPFVMFLATSMDMRHHDTLYVTNSALSDLSKLTRLFVTVAGPAITTANVIN